MQATFPGPDGEPDWDRMRRSRVQDLEVCIRHGPYFHRKAERIHALLQKAYDDFGEGTSFETLNSWPSDKARDDPTTLALHKGNLPSTGSPAAQCLAIQ
jgi:endonuclease III